MSWQICLICIIFPAKLKKNCDAKWSPILVVVWAWLLNFMILPFTLTTFSFGSCLYYASVSHYKDGWAVKLFSQRDNRIQQWAHGGWMVRSMKLSNQAQTKIGDHLATTIFFSLAEKNYANRKIRKVCQLNRNFKKTQMSEFFVSICLFPIWSAIGLRTILCCLQGQLCHLRLWFWAIGKMIGIHRINENHRK